MLHVASGYAVTPSSRSCYFILLELIFRLLISFVISAPTAIQPPHIPPLAHILQCTMLSDGECIEIPQTPLCQAVRAEDLWLAHF